MAEVLDKPNKTSNRSAERADKIMKTLPNVPDAGGDSEIDHQKSSSSQVDVFKSHEVDEDEGQDGLHQRDNGFLGEVTASI